MDFFGTVYVTKATIPLLREQGDGRIIQISSVGGRIGSPGMTAYQSAKWAIGGFSEALAAEVAPLGIKITVVEPGGMRTDWAGSSMNIPPISAPYRATVGESARAMAGFEHVATNGSTIAAAACSTCERDRMPNAIERSCATHRRSGCGTTEAAAASYSLILRRARR